MSKFIFAGFDPRPAARVPAAAETNDRIFAQGPVLGIEVTVPALASRCELGNIDPQHTFNDASITAIEVAEECEIPTEGAVLATVRADLDSLGAMAVIAMRAEGINLSSAADRIQLVAEADRFARGGWPGVRPLPTRDNPWQEEGAGTESSRPLAAIAACVADFRKPLPERVAVMREWLLSGQEPEDYRARVERERTKMITALEDGAINVRTAADGRVAVVVSTHRAGTTVGYTQAPVVIALNPEFSFRGGEPHAKFTICQFETGYVNLRAVFAALSEKEPGWSGSPTIGGSPQGVSSMLSMDEVLEVVASHLQS